MNPENGAIDGDVGDSLFGKRQLGAGLCDRGPGGVDVLHGCFGARAGLIRHRARDVAGPKERRVALRRRLRQRVLRFGELEVGFGPADRRPRLVEPQSGVDALQPYEHRAFLHELSDVDRCGHDTAGGVWCDVRRFVWLEAAGGFERHDLFL